MKFKFGRKPRIYNPRIPHMSALLSGTRLILPPPPVAIDYTTGMPQKFGMMMNDTLGDCTCAAYYHARQIWSLNAGNTEITEPDANVEKLYEEACGYNPSDPTSDQGGIEQDVLSYLLNTGAPVGPAGASRDKLLAFLEVDYRNLDDLKRAIYECALVYIGINVPQSVMDNADDPTVPWGTTGDQTSAGGHAIILIGYDTDFFYCISWGQKYKISPAFFASNLDEAYALISPDWIKATGSTPLGMTIPYLEAQMEAIKEGT